MAQWVAGPGCLAGGGSLRALTAALLGRRLDKSEQRSDWGAEQLADTQVGAGRGRGPERQAGVTWGVGMGMDSFEQVGLRVRWGLRRKRQAGLRLEMQAGRMLAGGCLMR